MRIAKEDIILVGVALAFVSVPWQKSFNGFALIVLTAACIFFVRYIDRRAISIPGLTVIGLSILYFFLHITSLLYTQNLGEGLFHLEKKWTFALLPLCGLICNRLNPRVREVALLAFSTSLIIATLVCLALAARNNWIDNQTYNYPTFFINKWFFSYKLLSENIGIHPVYLSCYIGTAIIYLTKFTFPPHAARTRLICGGLIVGLLVFVVMLSSRTILFATIGVLALIFGHGSIKARNYKYILALTGLIAVAALATFTNEISKSRILVIFNESSSDAAGWGTFNVRFKEWQTSLEIIGANPVLGVAPGDFLDETVKIYRDKGWTDMVDEEYNSHNQFLQTAASLGIPGIFCLLGIFCLGLLRAISNQDFLYGGFLIIFSCFSLTESTLEVQKGIVFFNLLNFILFFSSKKW